MGDLDGLVGGARTIVVKSRGSGGVEAELLTNKGNIFDSLQQESWTRGDASGPLTLYINIKAMRVAKFSSVNLVM